MIEDVIISIRGQQLYEGQEADVIELMTEGTLERDPEGGYLLSYQESELTGLEGTKTVFHIQGNQVMLTRVGTLNSMMIFEEGVRHLSMYETPHGTISVGINTRHMRAQIDPGGGEIEINYAIEINHALAGQNLFQVKVKRTPKIKQ